MIKNIIFDLGGVLTNLDYHLTINAFKKLGFTNFDEMYTQFKANPLFAEFEKGNISTEQFYTEIKKISPVTLSNQQIDDAWNAMLLDFRTDTPAFLESLKPKYKLFLLSNTNDIHYRAFKKIFTDAIGMDSIDVFFDKAYYSHFIHHRKPDEETYKWVLNDAGIIAVETFFIDDSYHNIDAAKNVGLHTHLLLNGERIQEIVPIE